MDLIINCDDFGISHGVNYGVIEAYQQGVLSSTTALVSSKAILHAVQLALLNPNLGIGLHLSFDFLESLSKDLSLANKDGNLKTKKEADIHREVDIDVLVLEFELQYLKFLTLFKKKPTHLDSHHHVHLFNKSCMKAVEILATKYELPVRGIKINGVKSICNGDFYDEGVTHENIQKSILSLKENDADNLELCVHNAFIDLDLINATTYNLKRMEEHAILCSTEFKRFLKSNKIKLKTY